MRISNMLHFTEHHRFTVMRDFSLSGLAYRMLLSMYQPMIGAHAVGVYQTLYQQLPGDKVGYSMLEQQQRLFLQLELEPGEKGRRLFVEHASRLEAVGLLQTSRRFLPELDDYVYEYQLFAPLSPDEFFRNQHLTLLLRDKVGKYMLLLLRDELLAEEPKELVGAVSENISVPFYELFRLNTQVVDYELEQALNETAAARQSTSSPLDTETRAYTYTDIVARFPKGSRNRVFVEALQVRKEHMAGINLTARKYGLTLQETCRLLDEDGIFDEAGELLYEVLQYRASLLYRQGKRREDFTERKLKKLGAQSGWTAASPDGGSGMERRPDAGPGSSTAEEESGHRPLGRPAAGTAAAGEVTASMSQERLHGSGGAAAGLGASSGMAGADELPDEQAVQMAFYLEVPPYFRGQCDIHQYNMLLRNQPYTLVLKKFFPQGKVPDGVLDIFEKLDLTYGLPEEVMNVLIHFIHVDRRSWAKSSIEALASDLLGKHIGTYEDAVEYIREKARYKARMSGGRTGGMDAGNAGAAGSAGSEHAGGSGGAKSRGSAAGGAGRAGGSRGGKQKPLIPAIGHRSTGSGPTLTAEEMEEARRLAKKLDGKL